MECGLTKGGIASASKERWLRNDRVGVKELRAALWSYSQ